MQHLLEIQMSTINSKNFATKLAEFGLRKLGMRDAQAALEAFAASLTDAGRAAHDKKLVHNLAEQYSALYGIVVEAKPAGKNGILSELTLHSEDVEQQNRARVALSAARSILTGKQKAPKSLRDVLVRKAKSDKPEIKAEAREAAYAALAELIVAGDAAAMKRVKQLALLAAKV
jgi:hypothetical protein